MTRLDFFACGSSSPRGGAWGGTVSRITIGQNVHVPSTDETTKRKLYTRVRLMGIPRGVIRRTDGRTDGLVWIGRSVGRFIVRGHVRSVGSCVSRSAVARPSFRARGLRHGVHSGERRRAIRANASTWIFYIVRLARNRARRDVGASGRRDVLARGAKRAGG